MRLLIVEDDDGAFEDIREALGAVLNIGSHERASCLSEARDVILSDTFDFDLILCDLRIPVESGSLAADESHGLAVQAEARLRRPGVPLLFLTAFGGPILARPLSEAPSLDPFGDGDPMGLVSWIDKDDVSAWQDFVVRFDARLNGLLTVADVRTNSALSPMALRALQIYAAGCAAVVVDCIDAKGYSSAETVRATFRNATGQAVATTFVKVADHQAIASEGRRYDQFVSAQLDHRDCVPVAARLLGNLQSKGALINKLARADCISLFSFLKGNETDTLIVEQLRSALAPWEQQQEAELVTLGDLRRQRISDNRLSEELLKAGLSTFMELHDLHTLERSTLPVVTAVQHGDLHGENILVQEGRPTIIDYGDINRWPRALDPLTLEFSLVFHRDGPAHKRDWPSLEEAAAWPDLDAYAAGSPYTDFVCACRSWTEAADRTQAMAAAYGHIMRQFKFADVPKLQVAAFAEGVSKDLRRLLQVKSRP